MAPTLQCSFETFSTNFDLPLKVAAEKFGVRATAFKKRCRAIGIRHWPYRKVRSLKRSLAELQRCQEAQQLTSKQESQITSLKKQLSGLMSPSTYGIESKDAIIPLTIKDKSNKDGCLTFSAHKRTSSDIFDGQSSDESSDEERDRKQLKFSPVLKTDSQHHRPLFKPLSNLSNTLKSPLDWTPALPAALPHELDLGSQRMFFDHDNKLFGFRFMDGSERESSCESDFGTPLSFETDLSSPSVEDFAPFPDRYDEDFSDFLVDMDKEAGQNFLDDLSLPKLYEKFHA